MPPKKNPPTKIWKSAGKEQLFLEKLLREQTVLPTDKPMEVQDMFPMFAGFKRDQFRKHWSLTKQKFETGCKFHFLIYYSL